MRRREFITLLGGVSVWPCAAHAQQRTIPVIGHLSTVSAPAIAHLIEAFHGSLAAAGYVVGRNVAIEYRSAEGHYDRLPALAAELVRERVDVIVANPTPAALAAKAATAAIPIVFTGPDDPVKIGLVASFNRPGGNVTGLYFFLSALGAKQLGLLRELIPTAARIGLLLNPHNRNVEAVTGEVKAAAATLGVQINVVQAADSRAIDAAFSVLVRERADALLVGSDPFLFSRRVQITTLATRHALPAVYNVREYAQAGGLMSYGTSLREVYRQVGGYVGRILKGEKPADLPVVQSTTFEFVINLPTARALGIDVPPILLARADEVIE